jgi:hypothetical protein
VGLAFSIPDASSAQGKPPKFITISDIDLNGRPDIVDVGDGILGSSFVRVTYNQCSCP